MLSREQTGREQIQRRLLWLTAISNQASKNIDESMDWAAMASMLNLGNVSTICDQFAKQPFE